MSTAAPTARGRDLVYRPVPVLAFLAQGAVLAGTFFMGLGWGGLTWLAGLAQAGAGLTLIAWLGRRRSWLVLVVPLVSALLTAGLVAVAESYAAATECSDRELASAAELPPPQGLRVELKGDMNNGCSAHAYTRLPAEDVIAHYTDQLRRHGWTVDAEPGTTVGGTKDGVRVYVEAVPQEGGLVIITVSEPSGEVDG